MSNTQEKAFAAQLTKLNLAMQQCGSHSRFLLMDSQRNARIENVVKAASDLLAISNAIDGVDSDLAAALGLGGNAENMDAIINAGQSNKVEKDQTKPVVGQGVGPSIGDVDVESIEFSINESHVGQSLESLYESNCNRPFINNPFNQRVTLRSSDESVVGVDDGVFVIRGVGECLLGATFYKDADHDGFKQDVTITLDLADVESDQDGPAQVTPENSKPVGFLRPSDDFDVELELGSTAFVGKPLELPLELANPDGSEIEFESSDSDVFEVDAATGAILPKGAGDAMLSVHIGDVKDDVMVSIKG